MKTKGIIDKDLQSLLKVGNIAAVIALIGVAAFAALSFVAVPVAVTVVVNAYFAGSMAYLMGIGYGIFNDLLAAKSNLPYFMLGHQRQQRSMIESNKVAAVGIAWGIAAVAPLALIAAVLFSVTALIGGIFAPLPLFVLPVMALVIPVVVIIADVVARRNKQAMIDDKYSYAHYDWDDFRGGLSDYQIDNLKEMANTPEEKAAWFANSDRNVIGFTYMPIIAGVALISMATLCGVSSFLPPILFSPLLTAIIPAALGGLIALPITAALIYLAVNHNKQEDNRYKLDFGLETKAESVMSVEHEKTSTHDHVADFNHQNPVFKTGMQKDSSVPLSKSSKDVDSQHTSYADNLRKIGGSPLYKTPKEPTELEQQHIESRELSASH